MKSSYIFLLALTVLIAGCVNSPKLPVDHELTAPSAQWKSAAHGDPGGQSPAWADAWDSEELREVLIMTEAGNRDIRTASARMEAALARAGIVRAQGIPNLGISGSGSRSKVNFGEQPVTETANRFNVGLTLNWEVDLWGRLKNERQAALADAQQFQHLYESARLSLLATTAKAWFNAIETGKQLDLSRSVAETFDRNARLTENLYRRGVAESLDFQLLTAQAQAAMANVQALQARHGEAMRQLNTLMGIYPDTTQPVPTQLPQLPAAVPAGIPSDILKARPDLLAAESRLDAAERRSNAAQKLRYPSIALTAGGGQSSSQLRDLSSGEFTVWNLAGNITAPIFQGGAIRSRINEANAQYQESLYNYEATILNAFREVENALSNEDFLVQQCKALELAVDAAVEAERIVWQRYERGLTGVVTVMEAQRRSYESRSALISAQATLHRNRVDLLLALGRDPLKETP
jgi:outer membrane protein, multidrug efflux system